MKALDRHGRTAMAAWGVMLALGLSGCWEANPAFSEPVDGESSSGGQTDGTGPEATTEPLPTTSGGGGTGTGDSGTDETTQGTTPPDSSGSTTEEPPVGSSGGGGEADYPPCMLGEDPVCEAPYQDCYDFDAPEFTVCTLPCTQDDDCPQPTTGNAPAVCAGVNDDQCLIDCAGGLTCPDGMECRQIGPGGTFNRCLWPS